MNTPKSQMSGMTRQCTPHFTCDAIQSLFASRRYKRIALALPSAGGRIYSLNEDFSEDVTVIRVPIRELIEETDVVVIVCS